MWDVRQVTGVPLRGANNILLTQALFVEFGNEDAPYTLKMDHQERNGKQYISLCRVFLESADEYEAAMRLVGNWKHWQKLCENKWFSDGFDQFNFEGMNSLRETMKMRDRSLAKTKLIEAVQQGSVTAAKILLDGTNGTVKKPQRRSSKEKSTDNEVIELFSKSKAVQ